MSYIGATGLGQYEDDFNLIDYNISNLYIITSNNTSNISVNTSNISVNTSNISVNTSNIDIINSNLYIGDNSVASNIKYLLNEVQNETQTNPTQTIRRRVKVLETELTNYQNGFNALNVIDEATGTITNVLSSVASAANILNVGSTASLWGIVGAVSVTASSALTTANLANGKADDALDIWNTGSIFNFTHNNVYHLKSGNVGVGFGSGTSLPNKLEVNGNINIPMGQTYRINNQPITYDNISGNLPSAQTDNFVTYPILDDYNFVPNTQIATTTTNGIMRPDGTTITIDNGIISASQTEIATTTTNGIMRPDGTTITINNGIISAPQAVIATTTTSGIMRPDGTTITINNGVISGFNGNYNTLTNTPILFNGDYNTLTNRPTLFNEDYNTLTNTIQQGTNISITANNVLNCTITGSPTQGIIGLTNNLLRITEKSSSTKLDIVSTPMEPETEPTVTPDRFVVQSFTYNGTGDFTPHTFNVPVNTLCDILIVGGGGGGSESHGGGGGAGAVIFVKNVTMNGNYTINVGRGGLGLSTDVGLRGIGEKGFDSEIIKTDVNKIVAEGGGGGGNNASNGNGGNGGSGGGGDAYNAGVGLGGLANSYTVLFEGISGIKYGFNGGRTGFNPGQGAGGGGAGAVGGDAMGSFETESGPGGNGRKSATIGGIEYDFKTLFGTNVGVLENDSFVYFGGGGGGGRWANLLPGGVGGLGGGGAGGWGRNAAPASAVPLEGKGFDGVNNTGGGGGGGGDNQPSGGKGGSGIVIIRYVAFAIPEGTPTITHKTLNFAHDPTLRVEHQVQTLTGVGGWRIVRFLPPNLGRWYQGDFINTSTFNIPTIGTPYNYTNEWAVSFGTFDEMFFGTFDMTYWLQCTKTAVLGSYANVLRPIIKSSSSSTPYSAIWYNRGGVQEDPWISIGDHPSLVVYGENSINAHAVLLNTIYGGACVLVRDSTTSSLVSVPNQYTLFAPSGTQVEINGGALQTIIGNYTVSVGATQSSVVVMTGLGGIGPVGLDPFPLANGSTITIRYSMFRLTTEEVFFKQDGLIKYVAGNQNDINTRDTGSWEIVNGDISKWETSGNNIFNMNTGNVGIGTANPTSKLHINGTFDFGDLPIRDEFANPYLFRVKGTTFFDDQINISATKTETTQNPLPYLQIARQDISFITSALIFISNFDPQAFKFNIGGNMRFVFENDGAVLVNMRLTQTETLVPLVVQMNEYDTKIRNGAGGGAIEFGNLGSGRADYANISLFGTVAGATNGGTFLIESGYSRDIVFNAWSSFIPTGTVAQWRFNTSGNTRRPSSLSTWDTTSDHRLKDNIIKANLNTCYDDIKKLNLYRYNYIDAYKSGADVNRLGFVAQDVKKQFPKSVSKEKVVLNDNREIPDVLTINIDQINMSLFGAVKQLIKVVENQNIRIKKLEDMLNIIDDNIICNDANEPYIKMNCDELCDIDDIEPSPVRTNEEYIPPIQEPNPECEYMRSRMKE